MRAPILSFFRRFDVCAAASFAAPVWRAIRSFLHTFGRAPACALRASPLALFILLAAPSSASQAATVRLHPVWLGHVDPAQPTDLLFPRRRRGFIVRALLT